MDLVTPRLRFEPIGPDHVELLVLLDSDPEVMRFINGGRPSTRDDIEALIEREQGHRWVAFLLDGDDFVGWFGLRPTGDAEYELGYRLRRDFWGQGLASEGSRALLDRAFGALGARRVWAQTMTVNERSRRVMEACGMTYVRTFHLEWDEPIEGTEHGDVEYELVR